MQVAAFEDWDAAGRTVDLITSGDAWHWIDPAGGLAKAAEVLGAGGTIARFWTTVTLDDPTVVAFDPVYREFAPEVAPMWRSPGRFHASRSDPFADSAAFSSTELRTYQWDRSVGTEEWLGLAATISDHLRLGPERLRRLLQALRLVIDEAGGVVHSHNETYALLNQRGSEPDARTGR